MNLLLGVHIVHTDDAAFFCDFENGYVINMSQCSITILHIRTPTKKSNRHVQQRLLAKNNQWQLAQTADRPEPAVANIWHQYYLFKAQIMHRERQQFASAV